MNPNGSPRVHASFNPSTIMNLNSIPRDASFNPNTIMNPNSSPRVQQTFRSKTSTAPTPSLIDAFNVVGVPVDATTLVPTTLPAASYPVTVYL
jgi:hypothetical protein